MHSTGLVAQRRLTADVRHSSCECGTASQLPSRLVVLILHVGPDVLTCSILCNPVGAFRDLILAAITV